MTTLPPPPPPGYGDNDPSRREREQVPQSPAGPYNPHPQYGYGSGGQGYGQSHNPNGGKKGKGLLIALIAGAVALLVLLGLLIFALTRGDDDPAPAPTSTAGQVTAAPPVTVSPAAPPVTTEPAAPPVTDPATPGGANGSPRPGADDARFLGALLITDDDGRNHGTYWSPRIQNQRQDVLDLGYAVCSAYDRGAEPRQLVDTLVDAGIPEVEANWVRAAAVVTLCPEHRAANAKTAS